MDDRSRLESPLSHSSLAVAMCQQELHLIYHETADASAGYLKQIRSFFSPINFQSLSTTIPEKPSKSSSVQLVPI